MLCLLIIFTSCEPKMYYNLRSKGKIYAKKGYLLYLNDLYSANRFQNEIGGNLISADESGGFFFVTNKSKFSGNKLQSIKGDILLLEVMDEENTAFFTYAKKIYDDIEASSGKKLAYGLPVKILYQKPDIEEDESYEFREELEGYFFFMDTRHEVTIKPGYTLVEIDWDWMETNTNFSILKNDAGENLENSGV